MLRKWTLNWLLVLSLLLSLIPSVAYSAPSPDSGSPPVQDRATVSQALTDSSLFFVENQGQFDGAARFKVQAGGQTLWLAADALWLTLIDKPPVAKSISIGRNAPDSDQGAESIYVSHSAVPIPAR